MDVLKLVPMTFHVERIDHVVLRVRDVAAMVRFYEQALGFKVERTIERLGLVLHARHGVMTQKFTTVFHASTHVNAPVHLVPGGLGVGEIALEHNIRILGPNCIGLVNFADRPLLARQLLDAWREPLGLYNST